MVDNFIYEIENYGTLLNANRTYFLSRSQPPFLTRMVLGVYEQDPTTSAWLRRALPAIGRYYRFWTTDPHRDRRRRPVALLRSRRRARARGAGRREATRRAGPTTTGRASTTGRTTSTDYDESLYYDSAGAIASPILFYKGDRSMRESGFDPSNRFGALERRHHSLRAGLPERPALPSWRDDAARIMDTLGDRGGRHVARGRGVTARSRQPAVMGRSRRVSTYDYNFMTRRLRRYDFATTFYPAVGGDRDRRRRQRRACAATCRSSRLRADC